MPFAEKFRLYGRAFAIGLPQNSCVVGYLPIFQLVLDTKRTFNKQNNFANLLRANKLHITCNDFLPQGGVAGQGVVWCKRPHFFKIFFFEISFWWEFFVLLCLEFCFGLK